MSTHICTNCKHVRRGNAIDRREATPGYPAPAPLPRLRSGDYICARQPFVLARVDPQSGFQAQPSGEDCRTLNPAGECQDFADKFPLLRAVAAVYNAFIKAIRRKGDC